MRRLVHSLAAAALLCGLSFSAAFAVEEQWHKSDLTLPQALVAGYRVVDTYHNGEGHLFFVLQLDARLLLCSFKETQDEVCVALLPN
ncbi:MAG: hypothetical protein HQ481_19700 [Alphaproteobacteria bacterium]|nr:hypothetical protein [Alphaproteobacteria bacterium]